MTRRHNLRLIKQHECYTALELAALLKVNLGTVRRWSMDGLRAIDRKRPLLYLGTEVSSFLGARQKPHEPLGSGEFFCVCCKAKRRAANERVGLIPRSITTVDLTARCARCNRQLFRRTRTVEIAEKIGGAKLVHDDVAITISSDGTPHQMSPSRGIGR